jgi:hypothetical protein
MFTLIFGGGIGGGGKLLFGIAIDIAARLKF